MKSLAVVVVFFFAIKTFAQNETKTPRLVVGIVVDQMRNDYIYRYWQRYGTGGFRRLINNGFYFRNAHYNYIPTYTGPGHSSIYTGTTPRLHGIIANEWHVKGGNGEVYCVQDTTVKTVGAYNKNGLMSPKNQLSSTMGDELKMSLNKNGKVFGIALKDRSAILPAGHAANAAFWFDDESGNFISSSWYLSELPAWLNAFNKKKLPIAYLKQGWQTLYPISSYTSSIADDNAYEASPNKKGKPVFPYDYSLFVEKKKLNIIKTTPFGNSLTKDLALECLRYEQLGSDEISDLLCISFSSTDYVAHAFGPRAVEVEDVYLRLDKDLEELLTELDKEVGPGNYVVFLTADHGGADVPAHLTDQKIPAGYSSGKDIEKELNRFCYLTFNDSLLVENVSNEQVFLNEKKLQALKLEKDKVEEKLSSFLLTVNGVSEAYPSKVLRNEAFSGNDLKALLQRGYNHRLSGDVVFGYSPAWMDFGKKGTTHGAGYNYDTHVPVIFYGAGIPKGETFDYVDITRIAPTVCELLMINRPNSCVATPLNGFFK